jgi:hypothetical protein
MGLITITAPNPSKQRVNDWPEGNSWLMLQKFFNDLESINNAASGGVTSVTGTPNRITSSGGFTPTIDIAATYVGQTSITTLGTITTGLWNGTRISESYGGTNQNNYTQGDILISSAPGTLARLPIGAAGQVLTVSGGGLPSWAAIPGSGTVTSVSVINANGFNGTVATATTTPAITLTTIITGILKGNATAMSAAVDTDITAFTLSSLSISGSTIAATDTILTAFGKLQNQINTLAGGVSYQGSWNANTNTPALASGVGTKGYYYVVGVPGTTNLNGITTWQLGDWAIFNGTAWEKVDNTDAVVSVNGFTGAVILTKADIGLSNVEDTALSTWPGTTNITTLGTIGTGTWNASVVSEIYGGTNQSAYATGDMLYASGANTLAKRTIGTAGQVMIVSGGLPTWGSVASGLTGATGDLISFSAPNTATNIADVSAGSYFRSGGLNTLPLWSTLKLPNTSTSTYIPYTSGADNWVVSNVFRFDGTVLGVGNGATMGSTLGVVWSIFNGNVTSGITHENANGGTASIAQMRALANVASTSIQSFASGYTTSGYAVANGGALIGNGAGGLSIIASNASGDLRFYSGGNTLRGSVNTTGVLNWQNALEFPYVAKTANYTATTTDYTIDCTANSFIITLPTAVGIVGRVYNIINSGAGTITIATTSSQLIGNIAPTTTILLYPGEVINLQSDNANWKMYS